jgi:hypothetical protein
MGTALREIRSEMAPLMTRNNSSGTVCATSTTARFVVLLETLSTARASGTGDMAPPSNETDCLRHGESLML